MVGLTINRFIIGLGRLVLTSLCWLVCCDRARSIESPLCCILVAQSRITKQDRTNILKSPNSNWFN